MPRDSSFKTRSSEESTSGATRTLIQRQLCIPASWRIVFVSRVWKWVTLFSHYLHYNKHAQSHVQVIRQKSQAIAIITFVSTCQSLIYMFTCWQILWAMPCTERTPKVRYLLVMKYADSLCVEYLIRLPTFFHVAILITLKCTWKGNVEFIIC